MRNIWALLLAFFIISCNNNKSKVSINGTVGTAEISAPDSTVAVRFLNEYVENQGMAPEDLQKWLDSVATKHFITEYNQITEDDELDFDPILAAQDAPVKFELESFDPQTGYVIARGVDWEDFKVVLRIVNENNGWLVDGSGEVNIPDEKQIH